MADFYWRGATGTGHGLYSQPSNWAINATTTARHSVRPGLNDRIIFQAGAYPDNAVVTIDINFVVGSLSSTPTAGKITFKSGSPTTDLGLRFYTRLTSILSDKLFFSDEGVGTSIGLSQLGPIVLNGTEENYKGLTSINKPTDTISTSIISSQRPIEISSVALRNTKLIQAGFGTKHSTIDLSNKFNHFAGASFFTNSFITGLLDSTIYVSPNVEGEDPSDPILFSFDREAPSDFNFVVDYAGERSVQFLCDGLPMTSLDFNAKKLLIKKGHSGAETGIAGDFTSQNLQELTIENGHTLRTMGNINLNSGGSLSNTVVGGKANFSKGNARPGFPQAELVTLDRWTVKDIQSDSRNILVTDGTDGGNTEGFVFKSTGPLPTEETRSTLSTVSPISFGVVKTTKELTQEVTYSVEPLTFSATGKGIKVLDEIRGVTSKVDPINFTVAAIPQKITIGDRKVDFIINPIAFSVTAIPQKQQIAERLVEIQVNPINSTVVVKRFKLGDNERRVFMTIGDIFATVETTREKVKNETREIIAYINPLRMTVTSRSVGESKKYVAKISVIDTNQPHFIYVEESNPIISVSEGRSSIFLIGEEGK